MLRFKVFPKDEPAFSANVKDAYLVGSDRVPLRAEVEFSDGEIRCDPQARGAAALAILWPVEGVGRMMLETTRLLERKRPYNLHVELARGQLMRISQKREDWGLYDYPDGKEVYAQVEAARDLLLDAMTAEDDATAARHADAAITASVRASEAVGRFHADIFLDRRHGAPHVAKRPLGCVFDPQHNTEAHLQVAARAFDFVSVDFDWRTIEPKAGKFQSASLDSWLRVFRHRKIPVRGSLLSFERSRLPDWLPAVAGDFDHLREAVGRYLKYVLREFHGPIRAWEVIRGIHARNDFRLSFEQIVDFTRMSATLAKQLAPRSTAIIGLALPWSEYYRHDPRTIPASLYAEMVVRSGINFDALGLELRFGGKESDLYVRDLMQISAMMDNFGALGKPLHITAAGVPSIDGGDARTGCWRERWSESVQAEWLREFYRIALSKPFVETVTWQALSDLPGDASGHGVLREDLSPKPAIEEIQRLRPLLRSEHPDDSPTEE